VYVCVVVKNPPYEVSESGYGSFECRIDIYFRNKGDPRRLTFVHDLALTLDRTPDPIVVARCEKLTFRSPSEEFTQCLLRAGGVSNWFLLLLCVDCNSCTDLISVKKLWICLHLSLF